MGTFILSSQGQRTPAAEVLWEVGLTWSPKTNSLLVKQLFPTFFLCSHLIFMLSETFFKPIRWWESSMWWLHQSGEVLNHSPLVSIRNLSFQVIIIKSNPGHLGNSCDRAGSGNEWFLTQKSSVLPSALLPGADDCLTERLSGRGPQGAARPPWPARGCLGRGKRTFFHPNLNKRFEICSVFVLIACLPWRQWPCPRIQGSCDNLDPGHKLLL